MQAKFIAIFFLQFYLLNGIAEGQLFLNVTLLVFSGRPDPQWLVLPTSPNFKKIAELLTAAKTAKATHKLNQMPSRLGYKGYLIQDETTQKMPDVIIGPKTVELQKELFKTLPKEWLQQKKMAEFLNSVLKDDITPGRITATLTPEQPLKQIQQIIDQTPEQAPQQISAGKRRKRSAPEYNPQPWNDNGRTQRRNNCYNYANNKKTFTFAQPGRGSGNQFYAYFVDAVRNSAINDHLEKWDNPPPPVPAPGMHIPAPDGKKHLVALALDEGVDYHWYRLDKFGYWTHKPGPAQVTVFDNGGMVIRDPRVADRGNYNRFIGFMFSDRDEVTIA